MMSICAKIFIFLLLCFFSGICFCGFLFQSHFSAFYFTWCFACSLYFLFSLFSVLFIFCSFLLFQSFMNMQSHLFIDLLFLS
jgi:hypothetical protein